MRQQKTMHSNIDLFYQLSLCKVPYIGPVHTRLLIQHFGTAERVFKATRRELERIEGIGGLRARSIRGFKDFMPAGKEIEFLEKFNIKPYFISDPGYPQRLLQCYDPPPLLFYKGNADLNASRMISVVGTRTNSDYGKCCTETFINELASFGVTIISGLAFGIDVIAHKAAVKHEIPTVGVLAHGLDSIYPPSHAGIARTMAKAGGLLSEFWSRSKPDKHNFPSRNRIVAGISDATIVIETGTRGGSMITAELANSYHRDVFAVPGRINESKSSGCNLLIATNKAILLRSIDELASIMGWKQGIVKKPVQRLMFAELTNDEIRIFELIRDNNPIHIEELNRKAGMNHSIIVAALLNLELQNLIKCLPGKQYQLI